MPKKSAEQVVAEELRIDKKVVIEVYTDPTILPQVIFEEGEFTGRDILTLQKALIKGYRKYQKTRKG